MINNEEVLEEEKDYELRDDAAEDLSDESDGIDPEERRVQTRFNHYGRFQKH